MTYKGVDENGNAQYTVDIGVGADYVIFSNKYKQTVDIKFDKSKLNYAATSEKIGSKYGYKQW